VDARRSPPRVSLRTVTMPLGLRPGISFCEASGHLVFLDVATDRYYGLVASAEAAFRCLLRESTQNSHNACTDQLLEKRLLVDRPDALPIRPCPETYPATASLLDRCLPNVSLIAVVRALASVMATRFTLRLRGLAVALRTTAARKARVRVRASDPATLEREVAASHLCALLVRSHDQCLVRSLALVRRLAVRGERADLVIGVRVRPFSAHAWVQRDNLLLNDSCDGVRGYTPILIL
jgi:hypothetical protein